MGRDYLQEANDVIFKGTPAPLSVLLAENPGQVIGNLLSALAFDKGLSSAMVRKAAAYALGQIGEPKTLAHLKSRLENETADGVREAIVASITAIQIAGGGRYSQTERRQIIEEVYTGKRAPEISEGIQQGISQQSAQASRLAGEVVASSLADVPSRELLPRIKRVLELDPQCKRADFLLVACEALVNAAHEDSDSIAARTAIDLGNRILQLVREDATLRDGDILFTVYKSLAFAHGFQEEYRLAKQYCVKALELMPQSKQLLTLKAALDGHN